MFKVTVNSIAKQTGETVADATVLSIVRIIEDKVINQIAQKGPPEIEMPLPMQFEDLKDLRNEDAQKLVYGRLLQELDLAGFMSQLIMYENVYILKVRWRQNLDNNLGRELVAVIARHAVKKQSKYDAAVDGQPKPVEKPAEKPIEKPTLYQPPTESNMSQKGESSRAKRSNKNAAKSFF
jgi:hypothetical protein